MQLDQFYKEIAAYNNQSRVWVFQSDQVFSEQVKQRLEQEMQAFLPTWAAHGKPLKSNFYLVLDLFLIVVVDETHEKATGCSIDSMTNFVRDLSKQLGLDFYQRMNSVIYQDNHAHLLKLDEMNTHLINNNVATIQVFDNTVNTIEKLKNQWLVNFEDNWQSKIVSDLPTFGLKL